MHIASMISTSYGRRRLDNDRRGVQLVLTFDEIHDLTQLIERRADEAEAEGHIERADRLAGRAAALREAVR